MSQEIIEKIRAGEYELLDHADKLMDQAMRCEVTNAEQANKATDLQKIIQSFLKQAEDERKAYTKPLNDVVKKLNAEFKKVTGPLTDAKQLVANKLSAYAAEQRRIAQQEEERRRREMEEQALKQAESEDETAAEDTLTSATRALDIAKRNPGFSASGSHTGATGHSRVTWTFEVEDLAKVPRIWLTLNESAIRQYLAGFKGEIEKQAIDIGHSGEARRNYVDREMARALKESPIEGIKFIEKVTAVVR